MAPTSQALTTVTKGSKSQVLNLDDLHACSVSGIEQAGPSKAELKRKDSAVWWKATETEPELAYSWTTVSAQKATFASMTASADLWSSNNPAPAVRDPFGHRSNAVEDLWWPSPVLCAGTLKDEADVMPPMNWRDRKLMGTCWMEPMPAFWGGRLMSSISKGRLGVSRNWGM